MGGGVSRTARSHVWGGYVSKYGDRTRQTPATEPSICLNPLQKIPQKSSNNNRFPVKPTGENILQTPIGANGRNLQNGRESRFFPACRSAEAASPMDSDRRASSRPPSRAELAGDGSLDRSEVRDVTAWLGEPLTKKAHRTVSFTSRFARNSIRT